MPRLREIARCAGVSVSTVSRVLNDAPDARVSDSVRERILATAARMGYRPNHFARALRRGRGAHVVVCISAQPSHFSARRSRAISQAAAQVGKPVLTVDAASLRTGSEGVLALLRSQPPEAAVFAGLTWHPDEAVEVASALHSRGVHCVFADMRDELPPDTPCDTVRANRAQGSSLAARHLVEQGHRHIGLVSSKRTIGRHEGYEHALAQFGITDRYVAPLDEWLSDALAQIDSTREATRLLLETHPQVTALFCATDVSALAAMQAAHSVGRDVPDDLAVAGFDNDPWTRCLPTPLTTVEHPLDEMAQAVQDMLRSRLAGEDAPWRRLLFDYRLIARESTGVASAPEGGGEADADA